jgi:lipid-binding SYLF domain-containing protein
MKRRHLLWLGPGLVAGCASTGSPDAGAKRREIEGAVDRALGELVTNARGARELTDKAQGVLVFPQVLTAGLLVGGSYGQGALRQGTSTAGYYSVGSGSVGLLAGAQTRALYILFMTREALDKFQASNGWTIGADASVVLLDLGAEARLDTRTAQAPIIGLVRGQQGFMANLSLDGTRFSRLAL